jgi:hypothetical protein
VSGVDTPANHAALWNIRAGRSVADVTVLRERVAISGRLTNRSHYLFENFQPLTKRVSIVQIAAGCVSWMVFILLAVGAEATARDAVRRRARTRGRHGLLSEPMCAETEAIWRPAGTHSTGTASLR